MLDIELKTILGKEMVDFIADYLTNIRTRRVFPDVKPGYMRPMIDEDAPKHGEAWDDIFNDIERVIMPGVSSFNFKCILQ
jgi:histidine decarboxylase